MDRNQVTGLLLIFLILIGYYTFFAPEPTQQKLAKSTISKVLADTSKPLASSDTLPALPGNFAQASIPKDTSSLVLENEHLKVSISQFGGFVKQVELKNYTNFKSKPLILLSKNEQVNALEINSADGKIDLNKLQYSGNLKSNTLSLTAQVGSGIIQRTYTLAKGSFKLKEEVSQKNIAGLSGPLVLNWKANLLRQEKDLEQERTSTTVNYYTADGDFDNLGESNLDSNKVPIEAPVKWISFKQKFFNAGIILPQPAAGVKATSFAPRTDSFRLKELSAAIPLTMAFASGASANWEWFYGPNEYKLLQTITDGYERNVYLGIPVVNLINRFIVVNVFYFLKDTIGNYGVIILVLVILMRILLFPLSYKSFISMAKMRVLKPEIDALKEKLGDDMTKLQQEQMKLYSQVGINPLSGCIPLLLQMPVLLAMFNFFPNAIELRHEAFLWADDLSTWDSVATLPFKLPGYGDHVSLFTILMTLSTLGLTWFNNQTTVGMQSSMIVMSYAMPVVFMFVLNSLPAGLNYYYFLSNVASIIQQAIIRKTVDDSAIRRKLDENRVKIANKPKSGFAKRLEDAMKQAEEIQAEKKRQNKKKGNS